MSTDSHLRVPSAEEAYATPLDSPLYGPPPTRFRDGEVLTVQYRSDPSAVRSLLPEPLRPLNDVVMVQVARWGDVPGLGRDTYECNVMVAAAFDGPPTLTGSYSPYFYVDSDRAMAGGREFHGQPKRRAEVRLEHRGDLIVGTVAANGIEVFVGTLPYKAIPATFAELRADVDPVTNINLKNPARDRRPHRGAATNGAGPRRCRSGRVLERSEHRRGAAARHVPLVQATCGVLPRRLLLDDRVLPCRRPSAAYLRITVMPAPSPTDEGDGPHS